MKKMLKPSRPVAAFCIALVALAAVVPGIASFDQASLQPVWVLLPAEGQAVDAPACIRPGTQPHSLRAALDSRGPPFPLV
jgi:hypothetical protein